MADRVHQSVEIGEAGEVTHAELDVPDVCTGLVIFAHGSGSSRHSPRNRYVSDILVRHGFATLLVDLLTDAEEAVDRRTAAYRFDVGLLARRLIRASLWTRRQPGISELAIGYFGASTGAAAALIAAAEEPGPVGAIVSRGGRPDLADAPIIRKVRAPTLFIVGGRDTEVLRLNQDAARHLIVEHDVAIVEGATHLFEEQGALARVSTLAARWFRRHLSNDLNQTVTDDAFTGRSPRDRRRDETI